jgi:phospholipid transport system substrate-binding protein
MLSRLRVFAAAIALAVLVPSGAVLAAPDTPKQVIEEFYATLLQAMHDGPKLGYAGRYQLLAPAVGRTFDVARMARSSVGSYWDTMTPAQRDALVEAFRSFTIANYAHAFDDFGGEKFITGEEKETPRKDVIVYTTLVKSDGGKVALNYLLRPDDGRPKVIDVYLDGAISQLAVRRSEYTSIIREKNVDALIAAIKNKAQELSK